MTQYPLAPCRECAVPTHPEQTQRAAAGVSALSDKLTDAGALGLKEQAS